MASRQCGRPAGRQAGSRQTGGRQQADRRQTGGRQAGECHDVNGMQLQVNLDIIQGKARLSRGWPSTGSGKGPDTRHPEWDTPVRAGR